MGTSLAFLYSDETRDSLHGVTLVTAKWRERLLPHPSPRGRRQRRRRWSPLAFREESPASHLRLVALVCTTIIIALQTRRLPGPSVPRDCLQEVVHLHSGMHVHLPLPAYTKEPRASISFCREKRAMR
jgi:hypothetical protein